MLIQSRSLPKWNFLVGYAFAGSLIISVLFLKHVLQTFIGAHTPVLLLTGSIILVARYAGFGPSLFATVVAIAGINYLFMAPYGEFSLNQHQFVQLSVFSIESLCAITLMTTVRSAKMKYERMSGRVSSLQSLTSALLKASTAAEISTILTRESVLAFKAKAAALFTKELKKGLVERIGHSGCGKDSDVSMHLFLLEGERLIARTTTIPTGRAHSTDFNSVVTGRAQYRGRTNDSLRDIVLLASAEMGGDKIGCLTMAFSGDHVFDAADEALAVTFARHYAQAMDRARLVESEFEARVQADAGWAEAETANRVKDEFLGIVSHELRTPLNAIIGWVQLIQNSNNVDSDQSKYGLQVIRRNANAQVKIIEDLLDVSQIVAGKLVLETRPVVLDFVLQSEIDNIKPAITAKRIKLVADIEENVIVIGDAERFTQIAHNLIINALKFNPEGGQITVSLSSKNEVACLRVTDTGRGIEASELEVIFERFRQIDCSTKRLHRGLGLGLAIVRSLVEAHRGRVFATSEGLGHGATFTVQLPLFNTTKTLSHTAKPIRGGAGASLAMHAVGGGHSNDQISLAGTKVLVVDDELDSANVVSVILRMRGAVVCVAGSVNEALVAIQAFKPDVLISDIGMPVEDGFRLIERERSTGKMIPAIALTAYGRAEDVRRTESAGFKKHLTKPINEHDLLVAVRDAVNLKTSN